MNWKAIIIAGIGGGLAAARLDYHAWQQTPDLAFDWNKCLPRVFQGFLLAALTAAGVTI